MLLFLENYPATSLNNERATASQPWELSCSHGVQALLDQTVKHATRKPGHEQCKHAPCCRPPAEGYFHTPCAATMQGGVGLLLTLGEAACTSSAPKGQERAPRKHCSTLHGPGTAAKDVFNQQWHACSASLHTTDMLADTLIGAEHFALCMHVLHSPRPRRDPKCNQGVISCRSPQCHSICTSDVVAKLYIAHAAMHAECKSLPGARDPRGYLQSHHGPCWAPRTMNRHADLPFEPGQLCSCRLVSLGNMAGLCLRFQPAIQPARMITLSCIELKLCVDFVGLPLGILDQYCTISKIVRLMLSMRG